MLNDGRIQLFAANEALLSPWVTALLEDREQTLWIGTAKGLQRLVGEELRTFGPAEGIPDGAVFALAQDRGGVIWAGTASGLYRLDRGRFEAVALGPHGVQVISAILQDRDGVLWLGTQSGGLLRMVEGRFESLTAAQGLSNNRVLALYEDHEGGLWVATNAGLNRLRDSAFQSYTRREGLSDDFVRSIYQGPNATVWVGTSEGVSAMRDGRLQRLDGLAGSSSVMSLIEARDGRLWIGTYDRGLIERGPEGERRWTRAEGLPFDQVRALLESSDGSIWVGTPGGVVRIVGDRIAQRLTPEEGLPSPFVLSLYETRDGRIWIGTALGFAHLLPGADRAERIADVPAEDVFGFHQDALGTLWIAADRGLLRYRDGRFRVYGEAEGIAEPNLFAVLDDGLGHFWLPSNRGLLRVRQAELERLAPGERLVLQRYGKSEGLASSQCNGGSHPSSWRDREGRLWIATARGLSVLDPRRVDGRRPRASPRVRIEELRVDGEWVDVQSAPVRLGPGKRRWVIRYAGISFDEPEALRYRVRLLGFDADWSAPGPAREATYTNLKPGRYRFEVIAAGSDGRFGSEADVLELELRPFFYQTPWFLFAVGLALLALGASVPWLRARRLAAQRARLKEQVAAQTQALTERNQRLEQIDRERSELLATIQRQAEAFARQAQEDALTGLPNRRRFRELALAMHARALGTGRSLCLGLLDLDHFKRINDLASHQTGDDVLVAVARELHATLHPDALVARYGGEEFALAFPDCDRHQARQRLRTAQERLRALVVAGLPPGHTITFSAGLSDRLDPQGIDAQLREADAWLYRAKAAGRDRVLAAD